ncbi:hypothetical protein GCM10010916_39340 [Paenibacillus abyssi]|uniref:Uncharacterized protein n=1 Tax=Paenibacillus abyssi TaxID=1340531 RepID=A0A917LFS6_9BACL|nr:hypothetical protein GCM10010916_39340 [Paenibacillus abyssi]
MSWGRVLELAQLVIMDGIKGEGEIVMAKSSLTKEQALEFVKLAKQSSKEIGLKKRPKAVK